MPHQLVLIARFAGPETVCSHLVVLVHGYSGSAYDMRLLCSFLQLQLPNIAFLISKSNEQLVK